MGKDTDMMYVKLGLDIILPTTNHARRDLLRPNAVSIHGVKGMLNRRNQHVSLGSIYILPGNDRTTSD